MTPENRGKEAGKNAAGSENSGVPSINLPRGGGAIRGIDEKFGQSGYRHRLYVGADCHFA